MSEGVIVGERPRIVVFIVGALVGLVVEMFSGFNSRGKVVGEWLGLGVILPKGATVSWQRKGFLPWLLANISSTSSAKNSASFWAPSAFRCTSLPSYQSSQCISVYP